MKTATVTFHASHNYGSMLQAYALQQVMTEIFGENVIINLRTPVQKRMMRVITCRPRLGPVLKDITHLFFYSALKKKHALFERFISQRLKITSELSELEESDLSGYDLICAGSDQIWNPNPEDFNFGYLLPFSIKAKKISYAASMGPGKGIWSDRINQYPELLNSFSKISVRELGTKKEIEKLTGRTDIQINCDPVLLIDRAKWVEIINKDPIIKGKYIFLYTLFANKIIVESAKVLSRKYNLPVVVSNFTNIHDLFAPFKKHLVSGPLEFLNLLYNAEMVVTSSFHGTAFSILLHKPFVTINGLDDNRISNLLAITNLKARSVSEPISMQGLEWDLDFSCADKAIANERAKSLDYLQSCRS